MKTTSTKSDGQARGIPAIVVVSVRQGQIRDLAITMKTILVRASSISLYTLGYLHVDDFIVGDDGRPVGHRKAGAFAEPYASLQTINR